MAQTTRSSSRAGHFERRWPRRARWAVAVCLVAGATAAGVVVSSTPGSPYRLARVTTGSPTAELTAVGTLVPVNQASVAFDEAGTVATVPVTVGEHVTAGQTLATLVPGPLQATEAQAQSQVASAQATLAAAEASESETSTPSAGSSTTAAQELASAQTAVIADQRALDGAEHVAEVDLASAEQVCGAAPLTTSATGQATGASSTGATGRSSAGFAPSTGGTGGTGGTSCASTLGEVAHEQTAVSVDTTTLESDETTLAGMLSRSTSSTAGSTSGGAERTGAAPSGGSSTSPTTGQSTGATPASPQQLASDQAAVDVASAELAAAQRGLADAVLTTPLTGTVAAVGITPGQAVSTRAGRSGATAASIVVIAPGAVDVELAAPVADLAELAVGQHATVVADATGKAVAGTVTSIGLVATTSSSGVTTYPVTVTIAPGTGLSERTGGQASVAIVVGHATAVTVVPTSAVHRVGAVRTVDVDTAGRVSLVRITTGVVGARWTQVTAGLRQGQQVVLADLTAPLPSSTTGTRGLRALAAGVRVAGRASGRVATGGKAPRGG
ncbi:MAG: HlyD family efflux transporter periplasmic adaptor subunit [Actinomycetota bacterium]|nr:HlyD family efflux transporter periplasmic adaptor subunit [Actinomycetota bacterium]